MFLWFLIEYKNICRFLEYYYQILSILIEYISGLYLLLISVYECLTFFKSAVEQLLFISFEHSLKVNIAISFKTTVFETRYPKKYKVLNNVIYVPPKRGSLIRQNNENTSNIIKTLII
jgi:hypothetical protein